MGICCCKLPVQ